MKTTLNINDDLLIQAKRFAKRHGQPLRAVVEESLQRTLSQARQQTSYELPDLSFGDVNAGDPLELLSWQELSNEIYGTPDSQ